jgi:hypothetical protein
LSVHFLWHFKIVSLNHEMIVQRTGDFVFSCSCWTKVLRLALQCQCSHLMYKVSDMKFMYKTAIKLVPLDFSCHHSSSVGRCYAETPHLDILDIQNCRMGFWEETWFWIVGHWITVVRLISVLHVLVSYVKSLHEIFWVLQSLHLAIASLVHKHEKQGIDTFFPEKPIFQMFSEVNFFWW